MSTCVEYEQVVMTGPLDFSGQISGQGQVDELIAVLQGPLKATFFNGLIKHCRYGRQELSRSQRPDGRQPGRDPVQYQGSAG